MCEKSIRQCLSTSFAHIYVSASCLLSSILPSVYPATTAVLAGSAAARYEDIACTTYVGRIYDLQPLARSSTMAALAAVVSDAGVDTCVALALPPRNAMLCLGLRMEGS